MNERTKSIHSLVFLFQKNNCCEVLLPVSVPGWRLYYVPKRKDYSKMKETLTMEVVSAEINAALPDTSF